MAAAELTLEEILQAVQQLPETHRQRLLKEIQSLNTAERVHVAARRLRGKYRLTATQRQRMSILLAKGNAGPLTREEKAELNRLVEEFEKKTLALAQAITRAVNPPSDRATSRPATS